MGSMLTPEISYALNVPQAMQNAQHD